MPASIPDRFEGLVGSIVNRRAIVIRYLKDPAVAGRRTVHPHVLFESITGKILLHAVQIDGDTKTGQRIPGWRPFDVAHLIIEEITDQEFTCDPLLNLDNTSLYRFIYVDCVNGTH